MCSILPCLPVNSWVEWSHVYVALMSAAAAAAVTALALQHPIVLTWQSSRQHRWSYVESGCKVKKRELQPRVCIVDREASASTDCTKPDPFNPRPRSEFLRWDDYFMGVAFLSARRSKDPNKQVGACIVGQDNIILSIGYNGFPRGCHDSKLPWAKKSPHNNPLGTKYPFVCHAEMNAILNKNTASLTNARIYVTMFPCNECAKLLIQAGISEVIFYEDKNTTSKESSPTPSGLRPEVAYEASRILLALAGVTVRQHGMSRPLTLWVPAL
eukprot:jgi/Botrbrau1/20351/Bobra.0006s0020.1